MTAASSESYGSLNPCCRWCGSGMDYSDGGFFHLPILCTEPPGSNGRAHPMQLGPMRATFNRGPSTSASLPCAVSPQRVECRSFTYGCRSQTFDLDSPRATRYRQTVAHGPQRPELGPQTLDVAPLRVTFHRLRVEAGCQRSKFSSSDSGSRVFETGTPPAEVRA